MGREAECICKWGTDSAQVKVLLESGELILRGDLCRRLAVAQMQHVDVLGDNLTFNYKGEEVALMLGAATASKWRLVIQTPAPTLAKKLGIMPGSIVWSLGETTDSELEAALATAKELRSRNADLIIASVRSIDELIDALKKSAPQVGKGIALWIVYPKGKGHAIDESTVRSTARELGLIDTKVVSVSSVHTALRFILRN